MQEKMEQLWKEYKEHIDDLNARYHTAMTTLKNIPEKIPAVQMEKHASLISYQMEQKMAELGRQFKEETLQLTDEFTKKMERLAGES